MAFSSGLAARKERGVKSQGRVAQKGGVGMGLLRVELERMGELFGGAGYTAVSQMIRRTREKGHKGALKFKLPALVKKW